MPFLCSFPSRLTVLSQILHKTLELSKLNFGNKDQAEGIHKAVQDLSEAVVVVGGLSRKEKSLENLPNISSEPPFPFP